MTNSEGEIAWVRTSGSVERRRVRPIVRDESVDAPIAKVSLFYNQQPLYMMYDVFFKSFSGK
jgi:hypothetical protein